MPSMAAFRPRSRGAVAGGAPVSATGFMPGQGVGQRIDGPGGGNITAKPGDVRQLPDGTTHTYVVYIASTTAPPPPPTSSAGFASPVQQGAFGTGNKAEL